MKILDYYIPLHLQENNFFQSLHSQYEKSGKLSCKQIFALENYLGIEKDFFDWNTPIPESQEHFKSKLEELKNKLKKDRFIYAANKNKCIKAIMSILNNSPDSFLIDSVLYPVQKYSYRR